MLREREVDAAEDVQLAERLADALEDERRSVRAHRNPPASCLRRSRATSQSVKPRERDRDRDEQDRRADVRRVVEGRGDVDLRLAECLDHSQQGDERRVLLEPDEVVQERRDHATDRLREHDEAERLQAIEPERPRRCLLARVHRLDSGSVHLRDVRRVDEHERDRAPEELRDRDAGQLERGDAEAEDVDDEDRRDSAKEVGVDRGERPHGEEHGARKPAEDRDDECEDEDEDLRDEEDLHVHEEGSRDVRERLPEEVAVEEGLLDVGPARGVHDEQDEQARQRRGCSTSPRRSPDGRCRRTTPCRGCASPCCWSAPAEVWRALREPRLLELLDRPVHP